MKKVIIDHRLSKKIKSSLSSLGFDLIEMPSFDKLQSPVSAHPDMLMFFAGKRLITHGEYFDVAKEQFNAILSQGYEAILSTEQIHKDYPKDILFNSAEVGSFVFGKEKFASKHILDYCKEQNKSFVNVSQGYTKCSTVVLSDKAIITADKIICTYAQGLGIKVLHINHAHIRLDGYDHGFIGGCSGVCDGKVYFTGNVELHPDGKDIIDFCEKQEISPVLLSDEELYDGGSLFFI